ncbi:MAG: hypothetical protein HDS68_05340 [Bacteroidales bacterium]|nr:hypothetical protein [Bacteroidales bacterium]
MDNKGISSSIFADTCKIPRPTMSQILNGRNKKISDELISKIHFAYPDLSVLWLMFGEGGMTFDSNMTISEPEKPRQSDTTAHYPSAIEGNKNANSHITNEDDFTSIDESEDNSMFFVNNPADEKENPVINRNMRDVFASSSHQRKHVDIDNVNTFIDFQTDNYGSDLNTVPENIKQTRKISSQEANIKESNIQHQTHNINSTPTFQEQSDNNEQPNLQTTRHKDIRITTDSEKRITNIVVFYSDNSFQSFYPASIQ